MSNVRYRHYPTFTWQAIVGYGQVGEASWEVPAGPDLWPLLLSCRIFKSGGSLGAGTFWEAWNGSDILWRAPAFSWALQGYWCLYSACRPGFWGSYGGGGSDYATYQLLLPDAPLEAGDRIILRCIDGDPAGDLFDPWQMIFWQDDGTQPKRPAAPRLKPPPNWRCKLVK